jgi:hypothetical protein
VGSISSFAQNQKRQNLEENPKPGKMINFDGSVSMYHQKHPNCTCIIDTLELELPDGSFEMRLLTTNHNMLVSEKLFDLDGSITMAEVYKNAEIMPKYKSGKKDLVQYIKQELQMGSEKYNKPVEIRFIVLKNGKITNVDIDKNFQLAFPILANQLITILNSMPAWTPGMVKGQKQHAMYYLNLYLQ